MRRMKVHARLAVQFLVAYTMVFQQMPVAAFAQQAAVEGSSEAAQPAEQREAAADETEVDQTPQQEADADDTEAAQPGGRQEAVSPGAKETHAEEAPAAEDAQPLDANTSDGTPTTAETNQWDKIGTCLWSIDGDGLLTIKPKDENAGGEIGTDW